MIIDRRVEPGTFSSAPSLLAAASKCKKTKSVLPCLPCPRKAWTDVNGLVRAPRPGERELCARCRWPWPPYVTGRLLRLSFTTVRRVVSLVRADGREASSCPPPDSAVIRPLPFAAHHRPDGARGGANQAAARMDFGPQQQQHGCEHYRRGCRIVAPCCGEVFGCRHCHNDAKNSLEVDLRDRHEIPRHEIKKVICSFCNKEQDVQQNCSNCGSCMGKYFCNVCNFFDDDVSKDQYHCDGCGICRTGGADNFFHCNTCGCCYSNVLKDSHRCVERAMHHNCPVCFEYLFDSTKDISVLLCGHTIHLECMNEMRLHHHFSCPVCSRSACDMTDTWRKLDEEVAATPMPDIYLQKMVWILCNDCSATSNVRFHVLGHKCPGCSSYNTKETRGGPAAAAACSRVRAE